jgi:hypothetical protein
VCRETAAEENATAYYPILDRVSQGYFEQHTSEEQLYTAFKDLLHSDGHITEPEALASFEFALSVRSAAPRIEAHYQFYKTSVEPSLASEQSSTCGIWVSFGGKQYCSPQLDEAFSDIDSERYGKETIVKTGTLTYTAPTNYHSTAHLAIAQHYRQYCMPILLHHSLRRGTAH